MHQIRFRLGLRPRPRSWSLQRSPDPLAGFKGPTSKGRDGRGGEGRGEKGRTREGRGRGRKGEREGGKGKGEGERRDRGKGREGKENGDCPPTIFGLKVALMCCSWSHPMRDATFYCKPVPISCTIDSSESEWWFYVERIVVDDCRERQNQSKVNRRLEKKAKEYAQQVEEERARAEQFKDQVRQ